jgi:hypothetical protein
MKTLKEEIFRLFGVYRKLFTESVKPKREQYFNLPSKAVLLLTGFSLTVLWVRFVLKVFVEPPDGHWSYLVVTIALTIAVFSGILVFVSTYGFLSSAPDDTLDERELSERNRVYTSAYQFFAGAVAIGWIGMEILPKMTGWTPDLQDAQLYLGSVLITGLMFPIFLVAFRDMRSGSAEVEE